MTSRRGLWLFSFFASQLLCFFFCHLPSLYCTYHLEMPDWLTIVLIFAGYLVLMKWVLPRLGVPT